ncbi:MAG: phage portal protein [Clostridiales bacterium]|nr:phage portal protein [Clostridiales bacterium]
MGIMDKVRERMQSFLQINPPLAMMINIQELMDYEGNAIKNRIWYRGDANEIEQLYWQIPRHMSSSIYQMFWASRPTVGMEMRKIHTGLPSTIVDLLAGIVVSNLNDFVFENSKPVQELWEEHIGKENGTKNLLEQAVKEVLVIGDGAFKVSLDTELSEYPIIEFYAGDKIEFTTKRGRIQEVIFKSRYTINKENYELREHYGHGYIDYELLKGGAPIEIGSIEQFASLQRVEWEGDDMMAVPLKFYTSSKFEGRGKSIYDKKIDAFDSFDEAYSQWIDALRAGRTKEYIPESLIPRDPNTGKPLKPNPFDNRYIQTDADMKERAGNKISTESGVIQHESYQATYVTALDLCLQGLMSPSTLGVDVKKLDNAEAQREKEKATLYTRDTIIEVLQPKLQELVEVAVRAYYRTLDQEPPKYTVDVTFQDYANPSFESQVETISKGRQGGILSIEAAVDELYGDDRDDEWKAEEVQRLKSEQGLIEMEQPSLKDDIKVPKSIEKKDLEDLLS